MIDSEDQIDDLFRNARENYPLKTGEGNWESVLKELKKETGETAISVTKTSGKFNWRFLWLLLLLPLSLMTYTKFANDRVAFKSKTIKPAEKSSTTINSLNNSIPKGSKIIANQNETNKVRGSILTRNIPLLTNSLATLTGSAENRTGHTAITENKIQQENRSSSNQDELVVLDSREPFLSTMSNFHQMQKTFDDKTNSLLLPQSAGITTGPAKEKEFQKVISPLQKDSSLAKNEKNFQKIVKVGRGLYLGVLAGPDISTIKLQQVKNMGYSLGILLGYRFNKRFSLETDFLYDKKNYYTDGKYVNKLNLSIPSSVSIINLNGYCHMYEVDLTGRYDFTPYRKQHFFARGGLASYFMKEQDYSYLATWSNGTPYSRSVEYGNATNNLFSVVHLSAGYEYKVGKISLRIEPYLKIPTMGLGKGKLPVTSMSLYMGISVPLQ